MLTLIILLGCLFAKAVVLSRCLVSPAPITSMFRSPVTDTHYKVLQFILCWLNLTCTYT